MKKYVYHALTNFILLFYKFRLKWVNVKPYILVNIIH